MISLYLNRYASALHGLPAAVIDRKRIADLLDAVAKNSGAVSANRARSALSAMFSWAMRKGLHDSNPCIATEKRRERSRDRVLTDNELAIIWNTLDATNYGDILRLLILTGQRAGEIGGLRWSEIDFDENLISLHAQRTKNGHAHSIPMSQPARDILKARPHTRDLVFGRGVIGFNSWNCSRVSLDAKVTAKLGTALPYWTVHDLRRTFATGLQRLGVRLEVTEAILNHVGGNRGGVGGVYRRYEWTDEKVTAIDAWAAHVLAVASGKKNKSNVTPIRKGA